MANHAQQPDRRLMTCKPCKDNACYNCIDVLRCMYSDENICTCERRDHATDRDTAIMHKELIAIQYGVDGSPGA